MVVTASAASVDALRSAIHGSVLKEAETYVGNVHGRQKVDEEVSFPIYL